MKKVWQYQEKGGLDWYSFDNTEQDGTFLDGEVDDPAEHGGLTEFWLFTIQEKDPANGWNRHRHGFVQLPAGRLSAPDHRRHESDDLS